MPSARDNVRSSLILLTVLGLLFSLPIAAKTFSAHGALAAAGTALLVLFMVFLGPIAFALNDVIARNVAIASSLVSDTQVAVVLCLGVLLVIAWFTATLRRTVLAFPYLPVTCWAVVGALFCVLHIFSHTA